jgi:hypothetical protein
MKAMFRRLRRLENRIAPKPDALSQRTAELIRERRRQRLEAAGEPYEELPWHSVGLVPGRQLSIAETIRIGRQLAQQRSLATAVMRPHRNSERY